MARRLLRSCCRALLRGVRSWSLCVQIGHVQHGINLLTLSTLIKIRCLPTRRLLFLLSTDFSLLIHHKLLFYPQHSANPIHTLSTSFHVFRICYIFLFWQSYCCCCPLTGQCFLSFLQVHHHHDHQPAHSPTGAMSSLPLPAKSADDPSFLQCTERQHTEKALDGTTPVLIASLHSIQAHCDGGG